MSYWAFQVILLYTSISQVIFVLGLWGDHVALWRYIQKRNQYGDRSRT